MKKFPGFEVFRKKAESYSRDLDKTKRLLDEAVAKTASEKKRLEKIWYELNILVRMIRAWARKEYKHVPVKTIITVLAALLYFVNPFDVIPDFVTGLGLLDDITVITLVFNSIRKDIERFAQWNETSVCGRDENSRP